MDDNELDNLFREARSHPPDTGRLEFGFETRLVARLKPQTSPGWLEFSWRLAPLFAAVTIAVAGFAWFADTDWETSLDLSIEPIASIAAIAGDSL